MAPVRIRPESELRESVAVALGEHSSRIRAGLGDVEIEHVGSTSIPGALTKGDLDLLVRVDAAAFDAAVVALRELYVVHQPENWTPTYASFLDPSASIHRSGCSSRSAGPRTICCSRRSARR